MLSLTAPHRTWLHRPPALAKLATLCACAVALFPADDLRILAVALAASAALHASAGLLRPGLRMLRPLALFLAIILLYQWFAGRPAAGAATVLKLLVMVSLANLVTMTTRLDAMMRVAEGLLSPLRFFGLNPKAPALAMAMVIRFTPVLIEKGAALHEAWRARSPRPPGWRIAPPFLLLAIDDAEQIAEAVKARGGLAGSSDEEDV